MKKRFKFLRIVATVWKILAWLALVVGILGAVGLLILTFTGRADVILSAQRVPVRGIVAGIVTSVIWIFFAVVYFVSLYAGAEFIFMFLAIEENTRVMADAFRAGEAPEVVPPPEAAAPSTSPPPPSKPQAPPPPTVETPPPPTSSTPSWLK